MTYLPRIALLLIAVNLGAQEIDDQASQNAAGTDPALDSIAAEVFADDLPPAPVDEQTVPVADDADEPAQDDVAESGSPAPALPDGATDEEQLMYQYSRYLDLLDDHVYDVADTVAKRVVELTLKVRGPKSTEYSKARQISRRAADALALLRPSRSVRRRASAAPAVARRPGGEGDLLARAPAGLAV
jgi:hypothetical protein